MQCPACHADDDEVMDSRAIDDATRVRRRRECRVCQTRFTTYETYDAGEPDADTIAQQLRAVARWIQRGAVRADGERAPIDDARSQPPDHPHGGDRG